MKSSTRSALPRPLRQLVRPVIRDQHELRSYVLHLTFAVVAIALSVDIVNQSLFASTWLDAFRSWVITVLLAGGIALGASLLVGRAYLELYRAKAAAEVLSRTDALTGLPNRRAFFEYAEDRPTNAMVLIIADIDRFKRVNDTRGHLAGDEVLRVIGQMMARELGPLGFLGRVGGEEFAVVAAAGPPKDILKGLEKFCARLAGTPIVYGGVALSVTVSAGIAIRSGDSTFNDLYADADAALYQAKLSGRNRIELSSSFKEALSGDSDPDLARWRGDAAADSTRTASNRDPLDSVA
jgi:diguanylate cyclase (GGDEF)-like protein